MRETTDYRHHIRTLKAIGFDSVRFNTWVPPVEYMDTADVLGKVMGIESSNSTAYAEWEKSSVIAVSIRLSAWIPQVMNCRSMTHMLNCFSTPSVVR